MHLYEVINDFHKDFRRICKLTNIQESENCCKVKFKQDRVSKKNYLSTHVPHFYQIFTKIRYLNYNATINEWLGPHTNHQRPTIVILPRFWRLHLKDSKLMCSVSLRWVFTILYIIYSRSMLGYFFIYIDIEGCWGRIDGLGVKGKERKQGTRLGGGYLRG